MLDPAIIRVTGDLLQYLIDRRINLFVSKKISASFDLVDTAVPVNIQFERINGVMVVFGSGSHALLAARITVTVAAELGVPGGMFGPASY